MNLSVNSFTSVFEVMPGCADLFLPIPDAFMQGQDWQVDDVFVFDLQKDGKIFVVNKSKLQRNTAIPKSQK